MTREEAKELLPIIQAFAEGKTIQQKVQVGYEDEWINADLPSWVIIPSTYRIKPEPKYRPFKTQEECWNEMHKHSDFGWIVNKSTKSIYHVNAIYSDSTYIDVNETSLSYLEAFENYIFIDGEPFGIKEEQFKKKCG